MTEPTPSIALAASLRSDFQFEYTSGVSGAVHQSLAGVMGYYQHHGQLTYEVFRGLLWEKLTKCPQAARDLVWSHPYGLVDETDPANTLGLVLVEFRPHIAPLVPITLSIDGLRTTSERLHSLKSWIAHFLERPDVLRCPLRLNIVRRGEFETTIDTHDTIGVHADCGRYLVEQFPEITFT